MLATSQLQSSAYMHHVRLHCMHLHYPRQGNVTYESPTEAETELFELIMKSRIEQVVKTLSDACAQVGAYYLLGRGKPDNVFDSIIMQSLPRAGMPLITIGMVCTCQGSEKPSGATRTTHYSLLTTHYSLHTTC